MPRRPPAVRRAEALDALLAAYKIVHRMIRLHLGETTRPEIEALRALLAPLVDRINGRR
jgi:hypothetical protein